MVAPAARRSSGERLFTAPRVPTGMNTGVSTAPWGVTRRPQRAAPSVARSLNNERGVAVGVEAVARADRVSVRLHDQLPPRERADQHEERRARQVEVGQEDVHRAEAEAGRDVEGGLAGERGDAAGR